jgi:coenzyme F420-reducing hydrogenase alpha subunit
MTPKLPLIARVEGEGRVELDVRDGRVLAVRLAITEPPRLFEKLLEGRQALDVPDLVARICGICPAAHQLTAVAALEAALGVEPGPWVRAMRRLLCCGEWIESHCLHLHLLALPDVLGFPDVATMARRYPGEVRRGLALQELGNEIIRLLGGRCVHPVGVTVGGFLAAPRPADVERVTELVAAALPQALELVRWVAGLPGQGAELDVAVVALRASSGYPLGTGDIAVLPAPHPNGDHSDGGGAAGGRPARYDVPGFEARVQERQVPYSTALHALLDGAPYLVGPLARVAVNADRLPPEITGLLARAGVGLPSPDLFRALLARAVEIYLALAEALALLAEYRLPRQPAAPLPPLRGGGHTVGYGATEAPRGLLWHRYELDGDGSIVRARIVPPTSQNQACIEEHLRRAVAALGPHLPLPQLQRHCESLVRCYDPCISCATHLVRVRVRDRRADGG